MADVKISELTGATTPLSGSEVVPLVQNGETKKVAVSEIGGGANPTSGFLPVNDNGVFVDSVVSENSNKIGIGTTSPTEKLDVVGAIALNDGNNSTKVGTQAGAGYTGTSQSAFGYQAGYGNTGDLQSAVGKDAGFLNTGDNQSAVGVSAGSGNTGGNQSAFGRSAGLNNTGSNQSAFGYVAGFSNTGINQSAFGYFAGRNNTGGSQSAFGYAAGSSNTGFNQSAFGAYAGYSNSGTNQSAFGNDAGRGNRGTNQSAFGRDAGKSNTGGNNSNFGYRSGYYLSDGTTINTASSNSVFLGASTKALGASQTNQIVIGNDATGIGANSVTLGNDSIATTALKGNVGIGTTSPSEALDVVGNTIIKGALLLGDSTNQYISLGMNGIGQPFLNASGAWIFSGKGSSGDYLAGSLILQSRSSFERDIYLVTGTTPTKRLTVKGNGNVGIGTTAPTEKLDVGGIVKAEGYKSSDGSAGITQNVNTGGGNTLVIKNGIITQVI